MTTPTKTIVSDIVVPDVFNPYVIERTAELSAFYQSGIISRNAELDRLASAGGKLINMPFWQDLDGDDEVLSDSSALTVGKIEGDKDVAALLARGRAWSVNDLAKALSGDDPMAAIGDLVADYWARRMQAVLISSLDGVFADATMSDLIHDIKAESGADDRKISANNTIDAVYKMGDSAEKLTGFAMHSAVVGYLAKEDLIDYLPDSQGRPTVPTYLGKQVVVDDSLPKTDDGGYSTNDSYVTYIFGSGAFGWGEGGAPVPVEFDRDSLASDDIMIHRRHFLLHPRGVAFQNHTVSGETPTNAELENAVNWARVYELKNVRMVRFEHTIT